jgi:hypothetical protein
LFGEGAAGVGDVNGDGHADFVIAAPFETITTSSEGHVVLYSGADGSVLRHHRGTSLHGLLGATCGDAGDLDGDGIDEYLLNELADFHGTDSGAAWLYSGRTGRVLYRFDGVAAGDEVNVAPRAADYDGDGEPDVILGSPGFDATGGNANGQVRAFHGNRLQLQLDPDAATTGATVTLDVRAATPGAPCLIAVVAVDSVAFYATLLIDYLDAQGEYALSATVPPGLGGHVLSLQALSDDPGRPPVLSNVEPIAIQ